jgi:hypothetical protein
MPIERIGVSAPTHEHGGDTVPLGRGIAGKQNGQRFSARRAGAIGLARLGRFQLDSGRGDRPEFHDAASSLAPKKTARRARSRRCSMIVVQALRKSEKRVPCTAIRINAVGIVLE